MAAFEPKISIIIPNYNRGDMMPETLDSILNQTYENWEAIIVDDGSKDNSLEVGDQYAKKDARITSLSRTGEFGGAPVCRNQGLDKSVGEYIIFLDSDDLLADFCLEQRVSTIAQNLDLDFWVFPMFVFDTIPAAATKVWNLKSEKSDISRFLSLDAVWQTSGPIWKKSSVKKIGAFTEGLACWQDVDIHLKALGQNLSYETFYNLKPDSYYRQHQSGSISQGEISSLPKLKARLGILKSHFENISDKSEDVLSGFKIMACNIAVGSSRTLHKSITEDVLRFGKKNGLISKKEYKEVRLIQRLTLLRLNRIGIINKFILKKISKYKRDSNIGKHTP